MLSYFLSIEAPAETETQLLDFFHNKYLPSAQNIPDIAVVRAFRSSPQKTAIFDDEGAPALLVQALFTSPDGLTAALKDGSLADFRELDVADCDITHQLFELVEHATSNTAGAAYGKARQSLAVRYYSTDDEEKNNAFRDAYVDGHPAALANFPAIRRVFCYLPVVWDDPGDIQCSNCMIGNEVVFDNIEDLNAELASSAMEVVKHHSKTLPRFNGWNTHFPMTLAHEWVSG
ncbi:MAG: hypothetical protein GY927_10865 [bacterium]|nr:hypothetical protein [bacterium]